MTRYQVVVRYGARSQRYHTLTVDAVDVRDALRAAAAGLPEEILPEADLVELRAAVDPDRRGPVTPE